MKLIVISSPITIENEHAMVNAMFKSGMEYFHLRKPNFSKEELETYLLQILPEYLNRIVIHSHHELAAEMGLKGIHYTVNTPYKKEQKISKKLQQSASIHTLEEIDSLSSAFSYAFLSPIFDSISKREHETKFNREELYNAIENRSNDTELIALGGINEDNIYDALELGFTGVAVLGAIWEDENPVKKFCELHDVGEAIIELNNLFNEE